MASKTKGLHRECALNYKEIVNESLCMVAKTFQKALSGLIVQ
jgi:hypothetical protein